MENAFTLILAPTLMLIIWSIKWAVDVWVRSYGPLKERRDGYRNEYQRRKARR